MNLRDILLLMLGSILLLASVFAQCSSIIVQGDNYIQVEQYSVKQIKLTVLNQCNETKSYAVFAESAFPVKIEPDKFALSPGSSKVIDALVTPVSSSPALYEVVFRLKYDNTIAEESLAVKVLKAKEQILVIDNLPQSLTVREGDAVTLNIKIDNKGSTVLSNVGLYVQEEGEEPKFYKSLISIQPNSSSIISFDFGVLSKGQHSFFVKAFSGDYSSARNLVVKVVDKLAPVSTSISVSAHDNEGYIIKYRITNHGLSPLKNLFVTVDDAPLEWQVISPSQFRLNVDETRDVEVILLYDENTNANVTIALYADSALIAEDLVELSLARLRGTGLFGLGSSFELGILILILIGIGYLFYLARKRSLEEGISFWNAFKSFFHIKV